MMFKTLAQLRPAHLVGIPKCHNAKSGFYRGDIIGQRLIKIILGMNAAE